MALTHQGSAITVRAQQIDERIRLQRQRNSVVPNPMNRRHAPGHQGGPVGHTHRIGNVEPIELSSTLGNGIDVGCLKYGMSTAAEMIRPVLVSDDKQKIGSITHGPLSGSLILEALVHGRRGFDAACSQHIVRAEHGK